jgi:Ca-activated chloride channel family protein
MKGAAMKRAMIFFMIFLMFFFYVSIYAATTGTISGKITDKETGSSIPGANIVIENTSFGAASDSNGVFSIVNVPAGKYTVRISMIGYQEKIIKKVKVKANKTKNLNVSLIPELIKEEKISVMSQREVLSLDYAPVAAMGMKKMSGISRENYQPFNTEEYSRIVDNDFLEVIKKPLSTFAADVDVASYANTRRFINQDQVPYKDAIRTEEFINYFNYDYKEPGQDRPLSINLEYSECPWNQDNHLIHIGLQGKRLKKEEEKASNLTFLIDVSGSMKSAKKLPLLQKAYNLLVDQLTQKDRIAIVVYAGAAGLVLPPTPCSEKEKIKNAIDALEAGGSTAGGEGIRLAYEVANKNFIKGGNNRVILATDGDFNIGISSTSELVRYIEEKRDDGIFLTVLGFGMGNYKDARLEQLADKGNGNHAYIDNILEAKKVLVTDLTATLFTIAKDVKIQVEFNPAKIESYRLIGYENRLLQDKDFEDDTKDAGEIGAGHTVTALYEAVPAGKKSKESDTYELRYQETKIKDNAEKTDEVLTVSIRYKEPDGDTSKLFSESLKGKPVPLSQSSDNFRFSAAVAEFAMLLRDSEFKGSSSIKHVLKQAKTSTGQDPFGYRAEFLTLVEKAGLLMKTGKK